MNKLTIDIEELGPIRNINGIEPAPVMIFTGASNLGKSYVNFLTYYVFNLFASKRLEDFFGSILTEEIENKEHFSFSFTATELEKWMEEDVRSFFIYLLNYPNVPCKVHFRFDDNHTAFNIDVREESIPKLDGELKPVSVTVNSERKNLIFKRDNMLEAITQPIVRSMGHILLGIDIRHAFLLPPGRASLLNESFTNQKNSSKTGMYDIFLSDFDYINFLRMRRKSAQSDKSQDEGIGQAIARIIDGTLESNKEGIVLKLDEQTEVPLSATASSIKELSPLLLWTQTGTIGEDSMCIEEPEAHAHPNMQYGIADLLAVCMMKGALMQITTHSDYLLARLNQLVRLHNLKQTDKKRFEEICTEKGIDRNLTLDKNLVAAYYFYKDSETHQVRIEKQNVDNGIPFTTFSDAVQEQIDWDEIFNAQENDGL